MTTPRSLNAHEPAPVRPAGAVDIWPKVIQIARRLMSHREPAVVVLLAADMRERDEMGRAKYGGPLVVNDGRDSLVDVYQERLDAAAYAAKGLEEATAAGDERRRSFFDNELDDAIRSCYSARAILAAEGR